MEEHLKMLNSSGRSMTKDEIIQQLQQEKQELRDKTRLNFLGILEDISMRMQFDKRNYDLYDNIYKMVAKSYKIYKADLEEKIEGGK